MGKSANPAYIDIASAADWEAWLADNHDRCSEVWLRIAKKASQKVSVAIPEALDISLCYGWIDSHRKAFDESYYLQRYSPRRAKSPWSRINAQRAEALIAERRMQPAGLAQIDAAKREGRWPRR